MRHVGTRIKNADLMKRKRDEIADAAKRVLVAKGFHQSTMREVAEEANVGVGSLYDYIRKKEDLLALIYDKTMSETLPTMRAAVSGIDDPLHQLVALLKVHIELLYRERDFFLLMYQESAVMSRPSLREACSTENEYVALYEAILAAGVERGVFHVDHIHLTAVAISFLCGVWALKRWNLRQYTLDETITSLTSLVSRGVMAQVAQVDLASKLLS